ncbi:unnamed protein product [Trifolium pratense]|uniref:Uncharacterized protein n=1 Tax=Trifolium pratense TaxID=57577 RepID=A0ACB0LIK6_TRIPR|nr:unnamed protein product [Trifolium pratense]
MQDQIENVRDAIRWSTDYLLKAATTTPDTLYVQVFNFADRYRGSYNDSLNSVVCPFYCSYSGYKGADDDGYTFSWDDKRPGTKISLSKEFLEKNSEEFKLSKVHADNFICSHVPGTPTFQAQYTTGGVLYKGRASNLQYVTSTTFLLLTYAKYLNSNGGVVS